MVRVDAPTPAHGLSVGFGRPATLALIALFVYSIGLNAECISPPPPCEAMKRTAIVLLAEVLDAQFPPAPNRPREVIGRLDMRLRVLERFKGVADNQAEIDASIPLTADSIMPSKGGTYLIFAHLTRSGSWQTACGRTRQVTIKDDDELRVLRQCRSDLAKDKR